jgi:hypothetical protein
MKNVTRIVAFGFLIILGGCATGPGMLVSPATRVPVGDGVSVMPQTAWNRIVLPGQMIWTQNGLTLDTVHFVTGVKDGAPLYAIPGLDKGALGAFDSKMLPNDVQDLVVSTTEKEGFVNVRSGNLSPCPFGSAPGFCFDLDFVTGNGLAMKGKVMAAKRADKLDVIEYRAPSEYYYPTILPDAVQLFASVEVQ